MAKKQNQQPDNQSFKDQRDILREINAELGKQVNSIKLVQKAQTGLQDIARKLQNDQENLTLLTEKQLKKLKADAKEKLRDLQDEAKRLAKNLSIHDDIAKISKKQLQDIISKAKFYGKISNEEGNLLKMAQEGFTIEQETVDLVGKRADYIAETNKKLGVTKGLFQGLSKIPIAGQAINFNDALDEARKNGGSIGTAWKNIGGQIGKIVSDPITKLAFITGQLVTSIIEADKATGDLAKNFNLSYEDALKLRGELTTMAAESGNVALNTRALQESLLAIGQSLGSNAKLNRADLETFTELREMAGYTNDELVAIQKLTLATGGNLKDNTKQFLGQIALQNGKNKLQVNEKQLLKEVANTSASIKLSIGGTTEQLAKSAFQAKQFGINLQQADSIASSLLDFESSISNELEAELITGKQLNLEKARLLAINGDIAGSSAEILKQVESSAEFSKMNRIQQEAIAKAVGLSRDELAASLVEREALSKLGDKDKTGLEAYNRLKKEGLSDAEIANRLGDEQYAIQLKQQSMAEQLNQSVEKLKEAFVGLITPLMPVLDVITAITSQASALYAIMGALAGISLVRTIANLGVMAVQMGIMAAGAISTTAALTMGIGVPLILAAVGAMMGAFTSNKEQATKKGNDVISPGYGKRTLMTQEGSIALNDKDTVIAGTDLGGKNKLQSKDNLQQGGTTNIDITPLIAEMQSMKSILNQILTKEGGVYLDSTKVGTAMNIGTYKTQ